jgi:DNA adenine methylase
MSIQAKSHILDEKPRPFLRWAGGKNWLLKHIKDFLPPLGFRNYHEPFLGGGSVFFFLQPQKKSFLSDSNVDLINTYSTVRDNPQAIINLLGTYKNEKDFYYNIRESILTDPVENAARFIYLNQTSFNGIYRVNLKGEYNVPFGYRSKDFICERILLQCSKTLQNSTMQSYDFDCIREQIKKQDLVFLDPPYTVSHNLNGFIKYNEKLFSVEDQIRLNKLIDFIKTRGAYYILTNAAHAKILQIFDKGDRVVELHRYSVLGGKNAIRGLTSEYLFTNCV